MSLLASMIVVAPPGYAVELAAGGIAFARAEALDFVRAALAAGGGLFAYAAEQRSARRLESGRGPLYEVTVGGARWVVRHARRGGLIARWLGDRYVRLGTPRPLRELLVSEQARARGIPTPAVLAAAVYPAGLRSYRGDVATELVPRAQDLAAILFGDAGVDVDAALQLAGRTIRAAHDHGLQHPDLNLKNVLVQTDEARPSQPVRAFLLDLDGCRLHARLDERARRVMLRRFRRSWRKWERRTGRRTPSDVFSAFQRGYDDVAATSTRRGSLPAGPSPAEGIARAGAAE
jgi:3-deoxy-D-manno-octulosonic acid kinase